MNQYSKIQSYLKSVPDELIGNAHIMICDCETTGFSDKMHDMISFSGMITDFNLDIKDKITFYSRPKKERWTEAAAKIHGFSLEEALKFPDPRKSAIELLHFLKPFKTEDNKPILFVSHDTSGFDYRFLKSFFNNTMLIESFWKVFKDDYRLSTINMGRSFGVDDNKLDVWAKKLNIKLDHHNAESDRDACFSVFKHILENTYVQAEIKEGSSNQSTPILPEM